MAFRIRDDRVVALARQVRDAINAPSEIEAIRIALRNEWEILKKAEPSPARERPDDAAKASGSDDPDLD